MEYALPHIGEGIQEVELVRWLVQVGDQVQPGQPLAELLTDKATMELPAPFTGAIVSLHATPGQTVKVGQPVLAFTRSGEPAPAERAGEPTAITPAAVPLSVNGTTHPTPLGVKAAPSVRHLARKLGVDLATVAGSGPDGRILLDDLTPLLQPTTAAPVAARPAPTFNFGRPGDRIPLTGLRRKIAERMVLATHTVPHYSYIDECDVTELVRLRAGLKPVLAAANLKLTYLPFIVKAVVTALQAVPLVNATLDDEHGEIRLHDEYHIGVAVATPAGLVVPVIHDADKKDLLTLTREIDRLTTEARAGKARLDDVRGGTFTVSSVGNIGGLISTPIIHYPEVGILGIGKVVRRPVYDDAGAIRPADLMYLSFSFDHRVVDGAVGAAFGNAVIRALQAPAAMLLPPELG
ncbi:MAG: dihydrolipoamide acetyltransferase family protein [Gemmataceae bacterium]